MKDQYAGDMGDYVKLALLRQLGKEHALWVAWYRTANDGTKDGRHTAYLDEAAATPWGALDPELHGYLRGLDLANRRISDLEPILPASTSFFNDEITASNRSVWFARMASWALRSDILFLDPDNGISLSGADSTKSVTLDEIEHLSGIARTLVIYHHQTRRAGGHVEEIEEIGRRLTSPGNYRAACAVRAGATSARAFFMIGPDTALWRQAKAFAKTWPQASFHELSGEPDWLGLTPGASAYHRVDELEARGIIAEVARTELARVDAARVASRDG